MVSKIDAVPLEATGVPLFKLKIFQTSGGLSNIPLNFRSFFPYNVFSTDGKFATDSFVYSQRFAFVTKLLNEASF